MWRQVALVAVVAGVAALADLATPPAPVVQALAVATPATDTEALIFRAADQFGVDRALARAVLTQESGGDPMSTSPVGAAGLMQVMPATAAGIAAELGIPSYDLYDPQTNATFGMYYLSEKIRRYGIAWGLAAYNWGPAAVDGFLSRHPDAHGMDWGGVVASYGGEIPGETQHYVANILAMATQMEDTHVSVSLPAGLHKADIIPDWQAHINAGFYTANCTFWSFQSGCQHLGTDIGGWGEGTPVYAPYGGHYTGCQDNGESGPYIGKWIEYTTDDGAHFLINHFRDSPFCSAAPGTRIEAGAFLGTMRGDANHVHVQVTVNGQLVDFEEYWRTH